MNNKWQIVIPILLMIVFQGIDWWLGETHQAWFTAAMPLVFLAAFFLIIWWILGQHRRDVRQILETHLPSAYFILNNPERLDIEMVTGVKKANKFIIATGGRARSEEYLNIIEKKILEDPGIEYWRVVLGDHIHHRLHQHLERLFECPNVHIKWHDEEIYGNIFASEDIVILPFADPVPGTFGTAQVIPDPNTAIRYKEFVLRLYGEARTINKEELKIRCRECSSKVGTTLKEKKEEV